MAVVFQEHAGGPHKLGKLLGKRMEKVNSQQICRSLFEVLIETWSVQATLVMTGSEIALCCLNLL